MGIPGISGSDSSIGLNELLQSNRKNSPLTGENLAEALVAQDDTDGDGLLSLKETPFDDELFKKLDADGSGSLSARELTPDAMKQMTVGKAPQQNGEAEVATASGSESSKSEEEEKFDKYDLNKDGRVTLDELLQAFKRGDKSLDSLFESLDNGTASASTQRRAMEAYQAQALNE